MPNIAAPAPGLDAEHLSVRFPGQLEPALDDVSLAVPQGRILALLGPSGCGKSTALRVIAGLQESAGSVRFGADDVTRRPAHRRGFSLMFQDGQLFGHLSVFENIAYGLRRQNVPRADIEARVEELLDLVGLAGFGERAPATLSGGQQQRVALARALAPRPRLLLLDEPLSALDRSLRERLAVEVRDAVRAEGVTAVFVTHDHGEALTIADDLALMRDGRVVQTGEATDVWRAPVDAEAARFLGYSTILDAKQARALGLSAQPWALRRTAWRLVDEARNNDADADVADTGHTARVLQVGGVGDLTDVVLALDALGGGEVRAAFPSDGRSYALRAGDRVRVAVDPTAGAVLP